MGRKADELERRARMERLRAEQRSRERRRTILLGAVAAVVVLALVSAVTVVLRDHVKKQNPVAVGADAAAAGCDPVITEPATGRQEHVGPGTQKPDVTRVRYSHVPPSSGEHYASPQYPSVGFYTDKDRPAVESLVHNLEHGYTIVWYLPTLAKEQQDQLRTLADLVRSDEKRSAGKFIVTAWDDSYGDFPAGKSIGITHWGAKTAYRQMCATVSGEAIKGFMDAHPWTDSPEPNAA